MAKVSGVGPDAEVVADEKTGAKQSAVKHRCDLMPPLATLRVAEVLHYGSSKYHDWNWFTIPYHEHLNHCLIHIMAFLAGDTSDDHMGHAGCRMMMALEKYLYDQDKGCNLPLTPHQAYEADKDDQPF